MAACRSCSSASAAGSVSPRAAGDPAAAPVAGGFLKRQPSAICPLGSTSATSAILAGDSSVGGRSRPGCGDHGSGESSASIGGGGGGICASTSEGMAPPVGGGMP